MKTLVIAEKPSVAADLARVLKVAKKGDIFENEEYVISSAIGHLVELEMPEDIDPKLKFWRLEPLPLIPKKFGLKPSVKTKERFSLLKKLLARDDVKQVVNACDAGREGELIFAYIYQLAKAKLPVKRAWMQTMTTGGIRTAFDNLRDGDAMAGLEDAARCRSESDWLIGINGTRAFTKRMFGSRAGNVATVGRVQTPTLAIVVNRELEIRNFVPRDYWRVTANFKVAAGDYEGVYQRPNFKKKNLPTGQPDEHDKAERIWEKAVAEAVFAACQGHPPAAVRDEKKAASQAAPKLYDLTSLQREANGRFGLPARRTLQIAQALYERHKAITYPRTDSRALPEDYVATCKSTLASLDGDLAPHARKALDEGMVKPFNKRIFDNKKISDHFAIIPTGVAPVNLDDMEAKIYDMIARRFVAAFYPAAEFDVTTRVTTIATAQKSTEAQSLVHEFKSEGKVLTFAGWLAVYGKTSIDDEDIGNQKPDTNTGDKKEKTKSVSKPLPVAAAGEIAKTLEAKLHAEVTKPPARYTEATLLSAMEGAGKLVDDEDLADAMKERGLGTPATRAETIENLVYQNYLERLQRDLAPTTKAEALLEFLAAVKADALTKPDMTGQWEYKLRQMEHGDYDRAKFMQEIVEVTQGIIDRTKTFDEAAGETRVTEIIYPGDGKPLLETLRAYRSQDGILTIYKIIAGRKMEETEIAELLATGEIGPVDGFVSPRTGNRFPSKVKIIDDEKNPGKKKVALDFGNKIDLDTLEPFWTDPKTGDELCEAPTSYVLRQKSGAKEASKRKSPAAPASEAGYEELFKVGRLMCQKPVTREHAVQLVTAGKTDLIVGFISKKGKPFDAYLLKQGGRINWEFPPRTPKKNADGTEKAPRKAKSPPNLAKAQNLGDADKFPGGTLYLAGSSYIVALPNADGTPRVAFEVKKTLCGVDLPAEEISLLVNEGRTNQIDEMISKKGTKFSAFLVLSKDKKKAEFEFPAR